jgi:hypothetical protein
MICSPCDPLFVIHEKVFGSPSIALFSSPREFVEEIDVNLSEQYFFEYVSHVTPHGFCQSTVFLQPG